VSEKKVSRYEYDEPFAGLLTKGSNKERLVELRGLEPLSFELASEASPGAAGDLMSDPRRAPARSACPSPMIVPLGTRALPRG